jgi:hypothetical protein
MHRELRHEQTLESAAAVIDRGMLVKKNSSRFSQDG